MRISCSRLSASVLLALATVGLTSGGGLQAADAMVRIADRELPAVAVGRQLAALVEADWIDQDEAFRAEAASRRPRPRRWRPASRPGRTRPEVATG